MQASGPQAVSMEDTFSHILGSIGRRKPASEHLRSEVVEIITFNPIREKGLEVFVNPQSLTEMLIPGKQTRISTQYHQVRPGGDIAVILGLCKHVLAADDLARQQGKRVLDVAFIEQHTHGFELFEAAVRATSWEQIEVQSGLSRQAIEAAGAVYVKAERAIGIYGMGLTQQVHGFENVAMWRHARSAAKLLP